jgi:hypothetical protein
MTNPLRPSPPQATVLTLKQRTCFWLLCAMACAFSLQPGTASAQAPTSTSSQESQQAPLHDGNNDFDFNIGTWHTHIQRILDPLSGSAASVELDGTVTVRKVWDGRAQLEEIEAEGPKGHWEGLTLFLYNPQSHQWSQSFIDSKAATLETPTIGSFKDGRGELFSQDTFHGKSILVRGVWSDIMPDSHRYTESYSSDGGKTWAPAFIASLTREKQPAKSTSPTSGSMKLASAVKDSQPVAGQNDFDFDLGTWKTHATRLLHPLTGSTRWVEMDGISVVKKVWDGRANLAEFKADGPAGPIELLSLRWFNPETHEWNLDFATPNAGTLGIPNVGGFKNGRGDFYDYELINGRSVLVKFSIWKTSPDTAQSEQAFSDDGGKTWEVNWINHYTRIKEN